MDIKLESATGNKNRFEDNKRFLEIAPSKTFIKIVFDSKITEDEINNVINISKNVPAHMKTPCKWTELGGKVGGVLYFIKMYKNI